MTDPVTCSGLTRSFGGRVAVDDVDLTVSAGEIHALVGLNGAGKTTLMRLLLGMLKPDSGHSSIRGLDVAAASPATWGEVGHLIESPFFYPELTTRENLIASALLSGLTTTSARDAADRAIEAFGLDEWRDGRASSLSLGNRQRLGLAAATLHGPAVLVLDEPANSLDPAGVVFTRRLLEALAGDGVAILLSSHHFDQLARVADRVSVMHRGVLVGTLDPRGRDLEQEFFDLIREADVASGRFT